MVSMGQEAPRGFNDMSDVLVTIFSEHGYGSADDWPPDNALESMAWFNAKVELIPEEFRSGATIDIDSFDDGHGSCCISIDIYYYRPETKEDREEVDRSKENSAELIKSTELAELDRLLKKYTLHKLSLLIG